MEESCHWSWDDEGSGRMGRGGGLWRAERGMRQRESSVRTIMFCEMGFANFNVLMIVFLVVLFLFFSIEISCISFRVRSCAVLFVDQAAKLSR